VDRLGLPDSVDAVRALIFDGRIPPAREVYDVIRSRQRQTDAAIGRPGAKFLLGSFLVN